MRPRASEGNVEVIAAALWLVRRRSVALDPIAERVLLPLEGASFAMFFRELSHVGEIRPGSERRN
jgi:hypothetical protein